MPKVADRGNAPKRSAERRRNNKVSPDGSSVEVDTVVIDEPPTPIPEPNPDWHPVAHAMWDAAIKSGQRVFYEPTDWAQLALLCSALTQHYRDDLIIEKVKQPLDGQGGGGGEELVYGSLPLQSGVLNAAVKIMGNLGFTEMDRRRMRIELERGGTEKAEPPTAEGVVDARRRFLAGGQAG